MTDFKHLEQQAKDEERVQQTDSLLNITALSQNYLDLQTEFKDLEAQAKAAKKAWRTRKKRYGKDGVRG